MAQERRAAQESASKAKKAKAQGNILVDENNAPTAEELRRRHMRAGRFGKGAVDNAGPARLANAPVYAVCIQLLQLSTSRHDQCSIHLSTCLAGRAG